MSPERTSPNGRFRTDWFRKEIGRIRVTYGYTLKDHLRAVHLLDELYANDQLDVLRALKIKKGQPGRIEIRELLAAKKARRHTRDDLLVDVRLQRPLWATLAEMIDRRPISAETKKIRHYVLRRFARTSAAALGVDATIADLTRVDWIAVRAEYASPANWNNLSKMIGTVLGDLLEDVQHPFRRKVMKALRKEKEQPHDVDITVEQFWNLVARMPEVFRPAIVTLAVTGMRLSEYLRCTADDKRAHHPGVYCPGAKGADPTGIIPVDAELWEWVDAGIPAVRKPRWIREHFHRAAVAVGLGRYVETGERRIRQVSRSRSGPPAKGEPTGPIMKEVPVVRYAGITLNDLRHLALQLALDGGAQINDVKDFARHADQSITITRYLKRAGRKRAASAISRTLLPDRTATGA